MLGGPDLSREYSIAAPDPLRDESFSIAPITRGKKTLLIVSGQSDTGIKQGIYYVMRHLSLDNGRIVLWDATRQRSPFIKLRVTHIGGYTHQVFDTETGQRLAKSNEATSEQQDWNLVAHWSPERLGAYADLIDFLGYNGIEEPPLLYQVSDADAITRRQTLYGHIQRNGMIAIAKIDGTLSGPDGAVPYGADTKEKYQQYYRALARNAAPFNDFVLTHWVDAGGWTGTADHPCTIALLQDLHMQIDSEFKLVNPKIESILSLWNLQNPNYQRWKGYDGVQSILRSGKIPPRVALAMSRTFKPDEAKQIVEAGHPAAIWGWYMADNELIYTMHVHTHALGEYFQSLPPDAGDTVFCHVMDNCQRETNLYSVYVAAQMMWNPREDPQLYLREIARLVYGPNLETAVYDALKAIADVRCGKQCRGYWTGPTSGDDFERACTQAMNAWSGLKNCQIDRTYSPPIRFHRPTATLLDELKGHTEAMAMYMQFLRDNKTDVPKSLGAFEYYERFAYLRATKH